MALGEPGVKTVNGTPPDVPPPQLTPGPGVHSLDGNEGVNTVTWSVPAAVILAAGITDAIPLGPMKMVVGRALPFHCTTEQDDKALPFAVIATGGPVGVSTAALFGEIKLRTGRGSGVVFDSCINENLREFELVPGPPDTVTATAAAPVPRKAVSAAVIAAVSCVVLIKVVGRGEPFQLATSPSVKPVPFTVRVMAVGLQYGVLFIPVVDAESEVMVARTIWNETAVDRFVLNTGLATAT